MDSVRLTRDEVVTLVQQSARYVKEFEPEPYYIRWARRSFRASSPGDLVDQIVEYEQTTTESRYDRIIESLVSEAQVGSRPALIRQLAEILFAEAQGATDHSVTELANEAIQQLWAELRNLDKGR